jgi:ferric-dicitrate binding protein FerR (iron transport regulator)
MKKTRLIQVADDEAARWMARRQSNEMTLERWREYYAWLGRREKNQDAIADYETLLASADTLSREWLAKEFEQQLTDACAPVACVCGK